MNNYLIKVSDDDFLFRFSVHLGNTVSDFVSL